jgi:hypothetical protein
VRIRPMATRSRPLPRWRGRSEEPDLREGPRRGMPAPRPRSAAAACGRGRSRARPRNPEALLERGPR